MVNDVKTPLREVRLRVAISFTLIMLSVDSIKYVLTIILTINIFILIALLLKHILLVL